MNIAVPVLDDINISDFTYRKSNNNLVGAFLWDLGDIEKILICTYL